MLPLVRSHLSPGQGRVNAEPVSVPPALSSPRPSQFLSFFFGEIFLQVHFKIVLFGFFVIELCEFLTYFGN